MALKLNKFQTRTMDELCIKILDTLPTELVKHIKEDAVGLVQHAEDKWRLRITHRRLMREIRFTGLVKTFGHGGIMMEITNLTNYYVCLISLLNSSRFRIY